MRTINRIAVIFILLFAVTAVNAEARRISSARASAVVLASTMHAVTARHATTVLTTLPPEEKPKTHWPWWLRILAVIGVLVFIRLVAGSVRNNPGKPGPG